MIPPHRLHEEISDFRRDVSCRSYFTQAPYTISLSDYYIPGPDHVDAAGFPNPLAH